jgi:60 kDa SS-A/Ro ribonucleoprotein
MANKNLFRSTRGETPPKTDAVNEAGGKAYAMGSELALATYSMTGTFSDTYYTSGKEQLKDTLRYAGQCDPEFIGKLAVYSREQGFLKDTPSLLCAHLTTRGDEGREVLSRIFMRVIDNGRMLRNFVQIMRSGAVGRKSLGSFPKKLVQNWFASKTPEYIFRQSVGNSPSIADVVKMVHPKAQDPAVEALFGYLIGQNVEFAALPELVREFECWKTKRDLVMPKVDFRMLTAQQLTKEHWMKIAETAPWHMTRMNLNTFKRHGVLESNKMVNLIANRLSHEETIKKVKVFPYQLLMAYKASMGDMPSKITNALHDALETATENIPEIPGKVYVFPDVSGSMGSPVTGNNSASSKVRCIDVAALVGACIKRKNPDAVVVPVDTKVHSDARIDARDTVMTNAQELARYGGGGTALGATMNWLNDNRRKADLIIVVSDNESWADRHYGFYHQNHGTTLHAGFNKLRSRCPNAKMVCLDIQPYGTTQAQDKPGTVLNIAGFSDRIFEVISNFAGGNKESWVSKIKETKI